MKAEKLWRVARPSTTPRGDFTPIGEHPELDRARLERVADLMNVAVLDCLVTGFEPLEAGLTIITNAIIKN